MRGQTGARLAIQRGALAHAEAVLLVYDGEREAIELDRLLDQCVRANQQPQLAGAQALHHVGALARRSRAGEQTDRWTEARRILAGEQPVTDESLDRCEVLLGECLGGRHQRGLHAALRDAQHRVQRDHRLARADLSHQQALHRAPTREVAVDLVDRPLLTLGEFERERPEPPLHEVTGRLDRLRLPHLVASAASHHERQLEQEQLLEGEAPAGDRDVLDRFRPVSRGQGVLPRGQPGAGAQPRRQRLDRVALKPL